MMKAKTSSYLLVKSTSHAHRALCEEKGTTMKEFFGSLVGVIVIVVVAVALVFGGVLVYWNVIAPGAASGQYNTNRNSQQFQAATIAHERDLVTAYHQSNDDGQKKAIIAEFCQVYNDITTVPSDLVVAQQKLCN